MASVVRYKIVAGNATVRDGLAERNVVALSGRSTFSEHHSAASSVGGVTDTLCWPIMIGAAVSSVLKATYAG